MDQPLSFLTSLIPVMDNASGPGWLVSLLLETTFFAHLVVVNALVGMALLCLAEHLKAPAAHVPEDMHARAILLPKGVALAVNLAIPPFLFLQSLYGGFVYSASILMAVWWLSVMLTVMLAYYGLYLHMTRHGLSETARAAALGVSLVLLLFTMFILVNKATLVQNPARWPALAGVTAGTMLNLGDPQIWPRYLHVLLSCLAVGGLAQSLLFGFLSPKASGPDVSGPETPAPEALARKEKKRRAGLYCYAFATTAQFPVGVWFLLSLPDERMTLFVGDDTVGTACFFLALAASGFSVEAALRRRLGATCLFAGLTIALMVHMRTILRESLLAPYLAPHYRPFEFGPLALFAGCALVSAVALVWLFRLYMRGLRDVPAAESARAPGGAFDDASGGAANDVLVNEIAPTAAESRGEDDEDETADARQRGNVTNQRGARP